MFKNFGESYYDKQIECTFPKKIFLNKSPLIVIDCSKQNEMLKYEPVDVRLEIDAKNHFPPGTAAYCLILRDRIIEYKPISGIVQKLV